jgi:hypothetical protein
VAADLIFFFNDRGHISQATSILTASNTAPGYAVNNARMADLGSAWKPPDSAATDEYLMFDGGVTTWLGSTPGDKVYTCVAYDARNAVQGLLSVQQDNADNPAGAFATNRASFTLNKTEVSCQWATFPLSNPARRYYRLYQYAGSGGRSAGNTTTAKILYWAMFGAADVMEQSLDFPANAEGPYTIRQTDRVGMIRTAGAVPLSNIYARTGQRFTVGFRPGQDTLFAEITNQLFAVSGRARAIFIQKEGVRNPAQANFFLARLTEDWTGSLSYRTNYEMSLEFETEAWV